LKDKFTVLTEGKPEKVISKLAIPTIISMLVTAFYNMADTYFVSKIDNISATAAVGISFSLMAIIQAVGFFFGQGSGNFISKALGRQDIKSAEQMAAVGFFYSFATGIVIAVIGIIFISPISIILGSTPTILPYANEYLKYILLGSPFIISSFVINNQLRFQGAAAYAMVGLVSGGLVNIILDPIFIFNLGTAGAAIATVISQIFSFVLLFVGTSCGGNLKIRLKNISFKFYYLKEIVKGGLPSLCRQGIAGLSSIVLNTVTGDFGDFAIAAISIVNRIAMFVNSVIIGFGQGFQPFCGFNYGAGLYHRVRKGFAFCIKLSTVFLAIASILGFIFADELIMLFRSDADVVEFGSAVLRFQCVSMPFFGVIIMGNMIMQNLGMVGRATFLSTARQGTFFIPLVIIMPLLFGKIGLQAAQGTADLITAIVSIPLILSVMKHLKTQND